MGAPLGNKNSTYDKRAWADAIRRIATQEDGKKMREAAEKLVDLAIAGDVPALRELGDRLDGKPKQEIEAHGDMIVQIAQPDANA